MNVVTYDLAEAMNLTSGEYGSTVNEFALAKLEMRASEVVKPPQVSLSPVSFECRLRQIVEFGSEGPAGSLVIGEIVAAHISESVMSDGRLSAADSTWLDGWVATSIREQPSGSKWYGRRCELPSAGSSSFALLCFFVPMDATG